MEVRKAVSREDLNNAFNIRKVVFVDEQGVSEEEEFDGSDREAELVIAYYDGKAVGTGRLIAADEAEAVKLGRICVLKDYRKFGVGKAILVALEEMAKEKGIAKLIIHAQTHAVKFYEKAGFVCKPDEEVFLEADIPHVRMSKGIKN